VPEGKLSVIHSLFSDGYQAMQMDKGQRSTANVSLMHERCFLLFFYLFYRDLEAWTWFASFLMIVL